MCTTSHFGGINNFHKIKLNLHCCLSAGHQWLLGLELDREVADTDQYLYTHLQQKWDRVARVDQST